MWCISLTGILKNINPISLSPMLMVSSLMLGGGITPPLLQIQLQAVCHRRQQGNLNRILDAPHSTHPIYHFTLFLFLGRSILKSIVRGTCWLWLKKTIFLCLSAVGGGGDKKKKRKPFWSALGRAAHFHKVLSSNARHFRTRVDHYRDATPCCLDF